MSLMIVLQPSAGTALVVGGGRVAERKVRSLAEAGFSITVIAPEVSQAIRELPGITITGRPFEVPDVEAAPGLAIVFACTDDRRVNQIVGDVARKRGLPVLVCDAPGESTFFSAATHRDGDLLVGVSTGGTSPQAARAIKNEIVQLSGRWQANIEASGRRRPPAEPSS